MTHSERLVVIVRAVVVTWAALVGAACGGDNQRAPRDGGLDLGAEDDLAGRDAPFGPSPGTVPGQGPTAGDMGSGAMPDSMGGAMGDAMDGSDPDDACANLSETAAPLDLACTGLYVDLASKEVAPGVRPFKPAVELWSDGADKQRWIWLPPGTQIDTSDPNDWQFPAGTKLFKEFRWQGKRVETRMFWQVSPGRWLRAAYHWAADEGSAERFPGGMVRVAGDDYYIPEPKECDQCHKGRGDRVLGFEAISLGLPGATGLDLATLTGEGLLSAQMPTTAFSVGDDGTGQGSEALTWLHVNCGVSCHNRNSSAEAFKTELWTRLTVEELGGGSTANADARTTGIGVRATTSRWSSRTRIVAGSPTRSLLYELANTRDPRAPDDQMPPIASRVIDPDGLAVLRRWIEAM